MDALPSDGWCTEKRREKNKPMGKDKDKPNGVTEYHRRLMPWSHVYTPSRKGGRIKGKRDGKQTKTTTIRVKKKRKKVVKRGGCVGGIHNAIDRQFDFFGNCVCVCVCTYPYLVPKTARFVFLCKRGEKNRPRLRYMREMERHDGSNNDH